MIVSARRRRPSSASRSTADGDDAVVTIDTATGDPLVLRFAPLAGARRRRASRTRTARSRSRGALAPMRCARCRTPSPRSAATRRARRSPPRALAADRPAGRRPAAGHRTPWTCPPDLPRAYRAATGAAHDGVPLDLALTLAWPALTALLAYPELAARLPELVHASHAVTPGAGVAAAPGRDGGDDRPARRARRPRRRADAAALPRPADLARAARRRRRGRARDPRRRPRDRVRAAPPRPPRPHAHARRAGDADFLAAQPWLQPHRATLAAGDVLHVRAETTVDVPHDGEPALVGDRHDRARGRDDRDRSAARRRRRGRAASPRPATTPSPPPSRLLAPAGPERLAAARRGTLADAPRTRRPASMEAFARVGGDRNPLHRSVLAARHGGARAADRPRRVDRRARVGVRRRRAVRRRRDAAARVAGDVPRARRARRDARLRGHARRRRRRAPRDPGARARGGDRRRARRGDRRPAADRVRVPRPGHPASRARRRGPRPLARRACDLGARRRAHARGARVLAARGRRAQPARAAARRRARASATRAASCSAPSSRSRRWSRSPPRSSPSCGPRAPSATTSPPPATASASSPRCTRSARSRSRTR